MAPSLRSPGTVQAQLWVRTELEHVNRGCHCTLTRRVRVRGTRLACDGNVVSEQHWPVYHRDDGGCLCPRRHGRGRSCSSDIHMVSFRVGWAQAKILFIPRSPRLSTVTCRRHPRFNSPWPALLLSVIIIAVLVEFDFAVILAVDNFINCVALLTMLLAALKLRFYNPDVPRPYRGTLVVFAGQHLLTTATACLLAVAHPPHPLQYRVARLHSRLCLCLHCLSVLASFTASSLSPW